MGSVDQWHQLLEDNGWTEEMLLNRYDMVAHLTTAALGAESFFTTANNEARRETPEEARMTDEKVKAAWKDHPTLQVIHNTKDFAAKINQVFNAVAVAILPRIGVPLPTGMKAMTPLLEDAGRLYLVTKGSVHQALPQLQQEAPAFSTYTFLSGSTDRMLLRRRRGQTTTFTLSIKAKDTRTQRIRNQIYTDILVDADKDLDPVELTRYVAMDGGCRVVLDEVKSPHILWLIRIDVRVAI